MRIEHDFSVPVPVEQAWLVLLDVERIAPCMPGAALTGIDGDRFTGKVAVRLGPVSLTYQGSGRFVSRDERERRVVIEASGQDRRGAGTAAATVTATLHPEGEATRVRVVTDLNITGRAAQYGRGMIADVSAKLTGQFADCLADHLAEHPVPVAAVTGPAGPVPAEPAGPVAAQPAEPEESPAAGAVPRPSPPTPATLPVPAPPAVPRAGAVPIVLPGGAPAVQTARNAARAAPAAQPPAAPAARPPAARSRPGAGAAAPTGRTRADAAAPAPAPGPAAREAAPRPAGDLPAPTEGGGFRRIDQPEPEPVDLLGVVGVPDRLRRAAPYLAGALAGAVLVWLAMRRRSR